MEGSGMRVLIGIIGMAMLTGCNAPRPLPTVREHGDRAFRHGDYAKAQADYREYSQRKPGEAEVELRLAQTLLELNQPHQALSHAQQAYDLKPGEDEYIETFAAAMFAAQKTDQLHRFLRNTAQDRGQPGDYIRLGRYAQKSGDADGAEHALQTAARLDGGRTLQPQLALANFYREIGDTAHEKQRLRMALFLDAKNAEVLQRLREMGEIPGPSFALVPAEAD
jgi:predicted Zn-dependent protease